MNNYRLTKLAQHDLEKIWEYTISEWSLSQAEKYIDGLLSSFNDLVEGYIKGKSVDSVRKGYKKASYAKHYIFFRTLPDNVIEIIRVLHVSMDVESHL